MTLTEAQLERYSRQLVLPEWSAEIQERLAAATAIVVGAGALGSPAATYLAAAGVGSVGVVDADTVEPSNLPRQPLHFGPDVGRQKAESAAEKLRLLNPDALVDVYPVRLDARNAEAIVMPASVVVDCSDSFETRYTVNDACCAQAVPLVEAGVLGFEGLVLAVRPGESACYRCVFPDPPSEGAVPSCREAGVLGAMAGVIGALQALQALKLLGGLEGTVTDSIVRLDGLTLEQTLVATSRREGCSACARVPAAASSEG